MGFPSIHVSASSGGHGRGIVRCVSSKHGAAVDIFHIGSFHLKWGTENITPIGNPNGTGRNQAKCQVYYIIF